MSTSYDSLSQRSQIRRLRQQVAELLSVEGRTVKSCKVLRHQHNTTFHYTSADGREAFVRISRLSDRSTAAIRAEAAWLFELHRDGHPVALPYRWSDGNFERLLSDPNLGPDRVISFWEWRRGKLSSRPSLDQWRAVGRAMANLHVHSEGRDDLGIGRWQVDGAVGNSGDVDDALRSAQEALGAGVRRTAERVIERYGDLRPSLGRPQLIHGDLHEGNVLFEGDTLTLVDFDDCGFAPALYDFCVPIENASLAPKDHALLEGYREMRPVPELLMEALPIMLDFRLVQLVFWVIGERANPGFADWWETWCQEKAAGLAARHG